MQSIEIGGVAVEPLVHFANRPLAPAAFFPGHDPAVWRAHRSWLAPDHWDPDADRVGITVQSWLLRDAGTTVLVDTGLEPGVPAGLDPAGVDLVVCTHLHGDHIGGNVLAGGAPAYPNARYLFAAADLAFFDPATLVEEPGRSAAAYRRSIAPILDAGLAEVWDGRRALTPSLTLVAAPGHTPGHGVVELASGGERALFAGDALHSPAQILHPEVSSCFCHDPAEAARTRLRLLGWAADHRALVVPAHFGGGRAVEVRRAGDGYAVHRWAFPAAAGGGRVTGRGDGVVGARRPRGEDPE
ncbi:MBL fold metallo-hydrolase [Actinomadura parmotrematis]|uniref:MBL fold metallo-hydrolase n=1 Tax=Actinomadura parmotrematis TaxID=2864039 RepID=A0ABS7G3U7_9ACTN|nr:MBL fold metallo-hydrolase [Actinomadura parmotrematis]MBW8487398.1 MBL fold metallo-hydrolase [Actinomadura parmotrematis]